jgi:hypothetical protein
MKYNSIFKLKLILFVLIFIFINLGYAQENGTKKINFLERKVIIEEEAPNSSIGSRKKEIEAPEGYTAIGGEEFTPCFLIAKYNMNIAGEQLIPFINLSYEQLQHCIIKHINKETIQLPDKITVLCDHFNLFIKETMDINDKFDVWSDEKGFVVLSSVITLKKDSFISYQEKYQKDKTKGTFLSIFNGQYAGSTEWEIINLNNDDILFKILSSSANNLGGTTASFDYTSDKNKNLKSCIEY